MKTRLLYLMLLVCCSLNSFEGYGQRQKLLTVPVNKKLKTINKPTTIISKNNSINEPYFTSLVGFEVPRHKDGRVDTVALRRSILAQSATTHRSTADDAPNLSVSIAVPASPTSASLLADVNATSVNTYTGAACINIPLWEVKSREASLPISLSYSNNGVRVDDVAGWVGTGWHLNAGGAISRSMRGRPDDEPAKGYFSQTYRLNNICSIRGEDFVSAALYNTWDTQPDVFSFSFDGYSGKFLFDANKTIRMIPQQALSIFPSYASNGELISFIVQTPEGVKYSFGTSNNSVERSFAITNTYLAYILYSVGPIATFSDHYENLNKYRDGRCTPTVVQKNRYTPQQTPSYYSTWYLTEKKMPSTFDKITLTYENDGGISDYRSSISETFSGPKLVRGANGFEFECAQNPFASSIYAPPLSATGCGPGASSRDNNDEVSVSETYHFFQAKRLLSITTDAKQTSVFFFAGKIREDLTGGSHALTSISIYDHIAGKSVKNYSLEYAPAKTNIKYPDDYTLVEGGDISVKKSECQRLVLNSLSEGDNCDNKQHVFSYTTVDLPRRLSPMQDYGGYYNENRSQFRFGTYAPGDITFTYPLALAFFSEFNNWWEDQFTSTREPSGSRAHGCSLISIQYPTGGKTEFTYQLNEVYPIKKVPGIRVRSVTHKDNELVTKKIDYNYRTFIPVNGWVSTGVLVGDFNPSYEQDAESTFNNKDCSTKRIIISSQSQTEMGMTQGSLVGYNSVKESTVGTGSTIYTYTSPDTNPDIGPEYFDFGGGGSCESYDLFNLKHPYPFPPNSDRDCRRGLLLKIQYLNEDNKLLKEVKNRYNKFASTPYYDVRSYKLGYHLVNPDRNTVHLTMGRTNYTSEWIYKIQETTTNYSQDAPDDLTKTFTLTTDYTYDLTSKLLREQRTTRTGNPTIHLTRYSYSGDFMSYVTSAYMPDWLQLMRERQMKAQPIEQIEYEVESAGGGTPVEKAVRAVLTTYGVFNNAARPAARFEFVSVNGDIGFRPATISSQEEDFSYDYDRYRLRTRFDSYDLAGNPTQETTASGLSVGYIWGHNRTRLIAKVLAGRPGIIGGSNPSPSTCGYTSFETKRSYDTGPEDDDFWARPNYYSYEAKTGQSSAELNGDYSPGRIFTIPPDAQHGKYVFSAWVKVPQDYTGTANCTMVIVLKRNDGSDVKWQGLAHTVTAGEGWKRVQTVIDLDAQQLPWGNIKLQCYAWRPSGIPFIIDEMRFHPASSSMETFTHQEGAGVTSVSDATGLTTSYDYNPFGQLQFKRDDKGNITDRYSYNYRTNTRQINAAFVVEGSHLPGSDQLFRTSQQNENYCLEGKTTYNWQFGDGTSTTTDGYISHRYATAGDYTATLIVSNPEYGTASSTQIIKIAQPLAVTTCVDGIIQRDVCNTSNKVYGSCTTSTTSNTSTLIVKVAGGCGPYTYQWQTYDPATQWWSATGNTASTMSVTLAPIHERTVIARCIITDACGNEVTSEQFLLETINSGCY